MSDSSSRTIPPPLVAIAAWVLPGAGYWLIGQRARALTVGMTIIGLFVIGLLIGGVRLIEVPGYGDHGQPLVVTQGVQEYEGTDGQMHRTATEQTNEAQPGSPRSDQGGWVMQVHPIDEIRNKPWYIPQFLVGPMNLLASWGSVMASRPNAQGQPAGARSHARTNELGVLYTAVAGMLNLLVIIDATSRSGRREEAQ